MMTTTITETAAAFFEACETGRGWDECAQYCHPDAVFAAQSEALGDVTTVDRITVVWPGGAEQTFESVEARGVLRVEQPQ